MVYPPGELSPDVILRSKPATLQPVGVRGGFRPAWVRWFLAKDGWDTHESFAGETVYPTYEACQAACELIKARSI